MTQHELLWIERELHLVLGRYAQLCDERDWALIDQVFSPGATAQYGQRLLPDTEAILDMLRSHLGGCGPSQHLLANLVVDVDMPEVDAAPLVRSRTAVRASHRGLANNGAQTYECMGYYHDLWTHTPDGWRIAHRKMTVGFEFGDRSVLAPAPGQATAQQA